MRMVRTSSVPAPSIDSTGNLVCTYKELGLGTTATTGRVTCAADATANYACINGGDNHAKGCE
jgi:hypothetical protein